MASKLGNKVKLVIYTQNRREVYWNFASEVKKSEEEIIRRMNMRILQKRKNMVFTVAIYYVNNVEVMRIKGHK